MSLCVPASATAAIAYAAAAAVFLRLLLSIKSASFLLGRLWRWVDERSHAYQSFVVPRYADGEEQGIVENPLYRKAAAYVNNLPTLEDSDEVAIFSSGAGDPTFLRLSPGQIAADHYLGARLRWEATPAGLSLRIRRHDRRRALRPYLQHVEAVAAEIELRRRRDPLLFTHIAGKTGDRRWRAAAMANPATLDTVAMEPETKTHLIGDLESFANGRSFYHRVGRPWRRSYLLHGPSGTGKSSLAAAMARFLCYDIYDLDVSRISGDELRLLLLTTTPRSVILVEDFDLFAAAAAAAAGDLIDGVFCCCGEERVIVFTMSGEPPAAAAVLRPGRIDVCVNLKLCDFDAFKELASLYLGVKEHKLFPRVEEVLQSGGGGKVLSPAEVGEIMIANRGSPSRAIKCVIGAAIAASGGGHSRRPSDSLSESGRENSSFSGEFGRRAGDVRDGGFGKDDAVAMREFKKLYGFIRRAASKRDGAAMTVAAAAAAASPAAE